jgi:hypothetical protein
LALAVVSGYAKKKFKGDKPYGYTESVCRELSRSQGSYVANFYLSKAVNVKLMALTVARGTGSSRNSGDITVNGLARAGGI